MNWRALFVALLAAPVWSQPHRHGHKHARQVTCPEATSTTLTIWTTITAEAEHATSVVAAEAVYATETVEAVQTSQAATTYSVQTSQSTASAEIIQSTVSVETSQYVATATSTAAAASATSTTTTPGRAVWLWQSDLIQDDTEVEKFLSFAESNEINSVYALIDRDMGDAVFQSFIALCSASGIAVEALMGNSQWILGTGDPTLESQLDWLEQYQGNASASAQFSGIHMDIEPWGLDGWASNEETYTSALQSIVQQITTVGAALGLPVAADLPYWADTITCPTTGKTLDSWMLDNLDTATFMTYRNTAAELLDIATSVLEAGNTAGKPVWLAVETVDAADALLISYYGKTFTTLSEDLVAVNAAAATYASFAGIAIHDYDGAIALGS